MSDDTGQLSFDDLPDADTNDTFGEGGCVWLVPTPLGTHPRVLHGRPYLVGQTFGRLTVIALVGSRRKKDGDKIRYWRCECRLPGEDNPHNEIEVRTASLLNGNTKSCGCLQLDTSRANGYSVTHGLSHTPTHTTWVSMRQRLRENPRYAHLDMDPRWNDFAVFLADVGERPEGMTLDRIDNTRGYWPWNCRWAPWDKQQNNRGNNHSVTFDGRTQTVAQWAREFDMPYQRLWDRLRHGWDVGLALTTPVRGYQRGAPRTCG